MAMNPMQRKANNYLLVGIFSTLIVTGAVIAFLFMQLNNMNKEEQKRIANMKKVYVVSEDIKSGATLDGKLELKSADMAVIPENALSAADLTEKTISKIPLKINTIVTKDMVQDDENQTSADLRKQEYNMIILPSQISNEDYVDIRLQLSNGVDYIVVSKKQVTIPDLDGVNPSEYTMSINLNESERMVLANAIIDAYQDTGALLYATTYVEPGLQNSIIPTYVPSAVVQNQLNANPNIEQEAKNALFARYNQNAATRTNVIDPTLAQYAKDKVDNIEAGVQQQITKAKEERERYLQSLGGY